MRKPFSTAVLDDQIVMVERFVAGRELTCAVIGRFVTDIIEIVPRGGLLLRFRGEIRSGRLCARASSQDFTRC